jgi:hypothetical protein
LDLDDTEQALAFGRLRANIENSAIDVLNRRARGEEISPEVAGRAAGLLAAVGTNREEAINALCDNLDLVPPQAVSSLSPLLGFKAANALIRIGSPLAFQGLLDNLKGPLPRKELLIIAHVMLRMDDPRVVATRIKIAFEDAPAGEAGATYRANLREVQRMLAAPDELNQRQNWPLLFELMNREGSPPDKRPDKK